VTTFLLQNKNPKLKKIDDEEHSLRIGQSIYKLLKTLIACSLVIYA
jgi:hypothetical protein